MPTEVVKFGEFELDRGRYELRRGDLVLKLEKIPMELLVLLVESGGQLITRNQMVERIWGKNVFLDTEHGINTAIRKIRQTLGDDPGNPRFVQTVTGKGYRFIAATNTIPAGGSGNAIAPAAVLADAGLAPPLPFDVGGSIRTTEGVVPAAVPRPRPVRPVQLAGLASIALVGIVAVVFGLNVLGVRNRLFGAPSSARIRSLAVLPLQNLSADSTQEYFADGMTDELITALAKNRNLRVVSRTSTMQYKGAKRLLPDIARELNVDGILEGSIERTSDRVHMTVQLIYAPTDTHVWAESYDRDLNQAFALPSELSGTIAKEVKAATSPAPAPRYINPEAHDAYLHGRYFWFTFNVANTLPYFEKAIQLQPDYAAAWSGLADTYAVDGMQNRLPSEVSEKVHAAALRAFELNPSLGEAHNSLAAWYLFYAWDPARAEAEARRCVELDPNYAEGHHLFSYILMVQHRYAEAEAEAIRSVELDPFMHPWELGNFYTGTRQYDKALKELSMQTVARPNDPDIAFILSKLYWLKGMYKESQEQYERAFDLQHDTQIKAAAHEAWIAGGEPAVERWSAAHMKSLARKQYFETESIASTIAFTGDKDETIKYLELSYRNHDPDLIFLQNEPVFDFLHSDPRYQALVKKIGLPRAY